MFFYGEDGGGGLPLVTDYPARNSIYRDEVLRVIRE